MRLQLAALLAVPYVLLTVVASPVAEASPTTDAERESDTPWSSPTTCLSSELSPPTVIPTFNSTLSPTALPTTAVTVTSSAASPTTTLQPKYSLVSQFRPWVSHLPVLTGL